MTEDKFFTSGENQSPGHWCRCCQTLLLLNAATFWASWGFALSLAPQRKARDDQECCRHQWPVALCSRWRGWSSRSTPAQTKNVSLSSRVLPVTRKYSTRPETQTQDASYNFDFRPGSVVTTPIHREYTTASLSRLLSDRLCTTSVSIYRKPIRHCLGVIFPKEYIVTLIYYYSYDDL